MLRLNGACEGNAVGGVSEEKERKDAAEALQHGTHVPDKS